MKKSKKIIMGVFIGCLMIFAAVAIMAGDVVFQNGGLDASASANTLGNLEFQDYNASCSGFKKGTTGGGIWSCD